MSDQERLQPKEIIFEDPKSFTDFLLIMKNQLSNQELRDLIGGIIELPKYKKQGSVFGEPMIELDKKFRKMFHDLASSYYKSEQTAMRPLADWFILTAKLNPNKLPERRSWPKTSSEWNKLTIKPKDWSMVPTEEYGQNNPLISYVTEILDAVEKAKDIPSKATTELPEEPEENKINRDNVDRDMAQPKIVPTIGQPNDKIIEKEFKPEIKVNITTKEIGFKIGRSQDVVIDEKNDGDSIRAFGVSDGVGTCDDGSKASRLIKESIIEELKAGKFDNIVQANSKIILEEMIDNCIKKLDAVAFTCGEVQPVGSNLPRKGGWLAATLVLGIQKENMVHIINIGDSRCYAEYGDGTLRQITSDLLINNEKNKPYIVGSSKRSELTGRNEIFTIDVLEDNVKRLIFMTDGVYKILPLEKMKQVLQSPSQTPIAEALLNNTRQPDDDQSIVVVDYNYKKYQ